MRTELSSRKSIVIELCVPKKCSLVSIPKALLSDGYVEFSSEPSIQEHLTITDSPMVTKKVQLPVYLALTNVEVGPTY